MSFSGKVVIVTGASSGIGVTTAVEFSKLGASVVISGRNLENLNKTKQQCSDPAKVLVVQADLTKQDEIKKIVDETAKAFGRIDVLVNNAGFGARGAIQDITIDQLDNVFNTNVRSVFLLTQLAVPYLLKTKGSIINVSSIAGLRANATALTYCMSKAALDQFTRCVALDLAPKGVRVNSVNPAVIVTDFHKRLGMSEEDYQKFLEHSKKTHALGRAGQTEEVAKTIVFLASEDASFITGETLSVSGGRHIMFPF